ncbi:MAG: hypothetical protein IT371_08350 [Deltaproteobacteria bacterium]|nr:hypothetical protein [Deltaproteobacteria bacterium]
MYRDELEALQARVKTLEAELHLEQRRREAAEAGAAAARAAAVEAELSARRLTRKGGSPAGFLSESPKLWIAAIVAVPLFMVGLSLHATYLRIRHHQSALHAAIERPANAEALVAGGATAAASSLANGSVSEAFAAAKACAEEATPPADLPTVPLGIVSQPSGALVVGQKSGLAFGRTPLRLSLPVTHGGVAFELQLPGYERRRVAVQAPASGKPQLVSVTLTPLSAD